MTGSEIAGALAAGLRQAKRGDLDTSLALGDTTPRPLTRSPGKDLIPAAVLVPLVQRDDGLTILLTQRTAHLANHAGQVSFPGGRVEAGDADPVAAALRETEEEIGLHPGAVNVLGRLDDFVTSTGFMVVPVVGLIQPPLTLVPDPFEVAEIFEVPLAFVLDPSNHQRHSRITQAGETRYYYAMPYNDHYIWGATASMLVNLYEVLADRCGS